MYVIQNKQVEVEVEVGRPRLCDKYRDSHFSVHNRFIADQYLPVNLDLVSLLFW